MKVVKLSGLRADHLYPLGNIPGTHFGKRLSQPHGHRATGRIMSMNDTIGNRTHDLPACSAVPQPTALPCATQRSKYPAIMISILVVHWPGSSVGIATRYGLDGPGIESQWGRDFPHLSRPALGPTQPSVHWVPGLSRG